MSMGSHSSAFQREQSEQQSASPGHEESQAATKQALVVLNPSSGQADVDQVRQALERQLGGHGWACDVYEITGAEDEDVGAVVRAACEQGIDLVVAAGGDGTVASVVNGLWQSQVPLGILPLGTGNVLARALAIPNTPESALELLAGDHALQPLDLLQVGDQVFVLNVSAGLSARVMRDTQDEHKRRFGVLAYVRTIAGDLLRLEPRRFELTVDGHRVGVRASEILVSNGAFLQEPPFPYGPPERFNDQQFDVYILTARNGVDYLRLLWGVLRRAPRRETPLRTLRIRSSITIDAVRRPQPVQADGEWIGHTPITIELRPSAVQVVVPRQE